MPTIKTEKQRYGRGLKRRKEVLGTKYVEARLKNRHPLTDEFQALITRYAWGEMWTRPVFDDRTRRLLMLAAIYCGVPAANTAFSHARKIIGP